MSLCVCKNIKKSYGEHQVIRDFSYEFQDGKITSITGKSGCGKSTLLNLIGLLDSFQEGSLILFDQVNIKPGSRQAKKMLRNHIGYLFQNFALVDDKTVAYNMKIAIEEHKIKDADLKIAEALEKVGLAGFEKKKISECSGGEQQRIAVARLLIKPCQLILADEPTGSLDEQNKMEVFSLLCKLKDQGKTIIIVTHDNELKELCDNKIEL